MIEVAIVGATGYAGAELLRLLTAHPQIKHILAGSQSYEGIPFSRQYPSMKALYDESCVENDLNKLAGRCDVIFLALPHGIASKQVNEAILDTCVVIDLGADFRLKDIGVYEQWYKTKHEGRALLSKAVYGLCELYRNEIRHSRLIANPGCYTTCSILTLAPLLKAGLIEKDSIIIDAKSGVSGAGRSEKIDSMFCECNESIKPYGVATHRHTPEIEEQLSLALNNNTEGTGITVSFTPHLVPMNRGILTTCYARLKSGVQPAHIEQAYEESYAGEHFIRLLGYGTFPETRWVKGSNWCDIGFTVDKRTNRIIACGALDNLVKGAAGQAVQNMNIVFGFAEDAALETPPAFPV